jgi:elongation factor G
MSQPTAARRLLAGARGLGRLAAHQWQQQPHQQARALQSATATAAAANASAAPSPAAFAPQRRAFAAQPQQQQSQDDSSNSDLSRVRNIGISAHIDSGKTTLTERILFYTGRIRELHEVRGKDGVGAKMDHMELEREKGITIQSAATYARWGDTRINIIDTPGHVDFTIEVERALRVLDGAVLVLCSVGGVQSQSITVDRQMRRYSVPRVVFVNKCDRVGANPQKVVQQARDKLKINAAVVQLPIGLEDRHEGVVDLVAREAVFFRGPKGEKVERVPVPDSMKDEVEKARQELVERVADVDDELAEQFLCSDDGGLSIGAADLKAAIRRATLALKLAPVFMGSAFKNRGVQALLDGVTDYLPCPTDVANTALDTSRNDAPVVVPCSAAGPFVGLAFKLEEGRYGQLTYLRVYSGTLSKGDVVTNVTSGKKTRVPRLVRVHADELEDIASASAGDIVALFGVECASGDTFTDGQGPPLAMTSIRVPEPVMSVALTPKATDQLPNFQRALARFVREDPTFRVSHSAETGETLISGMGELHLDVYVERMRREYKVDCEVGRPKVNYRETVTGRGEFNYLHKKQSGGSGQFARVAGYVEPIEEEEEGEGAGAGGGAQQEEGEQQKGGKGGKKGGGGNNKASSSSSSSASASASTGGQVVFENALVGNAIPPEFHAACEKGFREAANAGALIGAPVQRARVVLTDGAAHAVDSNEMAFRLAAVGGFRQAYAAAGPAILEPLMRVEVTVPSEFQGAAMGDLNRRKGLILDSGASGDDAVIEALVPLAQMFGYSTALRSATQGKGEFSMEYAHHAPVPRDVQNELTAHYQKGGGKGEGGGGSGGSGKK